MSNFREMAPQWPGTAVQKNFKLLKYGHIIYHFKAAFIMYYLGGGGRKILSFFANNFNIPPGSERELPIPTEGKNQALVGALPFCGEYPGPRSEDKFRSSNHMNGISITDGGKMADS